MEIHITWPFVAWAGWTLAGAVAAVTLRNLVHCALALAATFAGLAALYLQLDAQFVGFAQILIYVGAVAILIVFAILLTRGADAQTKPIFSVSWLSGVLTGVLVFSLLAGVIVSSKVVAHRPPEHAPASARLIGEQLMTKYVLPLEVLGLLLTAALIGAVILALQERRRD